MQNTNAFETSIKSKSYLWQSLLMAIILTFGLTFIRYFVPDFLNHSNSSLANYFGNFFFCSTKSKFTLGFIYILFESLSSIFFFFSSGIFLRYFCNYLTFNKGYPHYINECSKVINSCDPFKYHDRVAILIPLCNDLSENTILQTASQTYKCDVWLCDDSSNQTVMQQIDQFAKKHNFFVIHRAAQHKKEHPSKIGNIFYFLNLYGDRYDYILETDSSSIITSTFIENGLRFFHSPLIDSNKISAVVSNGSYYPTNNFFSYINAKQSQWTEAHMLNSAMRMSGSHVSYQGWGTLIKTSILKHIPLNEVECSMCDMARGFYISRHGGTCYLNPFDFSGKIAQQNMYRGKNQRMKWNGGDAFIYKKLVVDKKFDDKYKTIFIHSGGFAATIVVPFTTIFQLILLIVSCISNFMVGLSWSVILVLVCLFGFIALILIVIMIVLHANISSLIIVALSLIFEFAILFRRTYQLLIYGLMLGKWSSVKVTVKSKEKLNFVQGLRTTLFDLLGITGSLIICLSLILCTNVRSQIVGGGLFTFLAIPSILFIIASLFSYIKTKQGGNNSTIGFDIASNDFRYKYIKSTNIGQQQHQQKKQEDS